jgi:hypothetical protein
MGREAVLKNQLETAEAQMLTGQNRCLADATTFYEGAVG